MQAIRHVLVASVLGAAAIGATPAMAQVTRPKVVMHKDPSCSCCTAWARHIHAAGFPVEVQETNEIERVKSHLGVPQNLASCHTAVVDGYVIEGHVPADAIKRLLSERPQAKGLAVPGMPVGSPGMEIQGVENDAYDVVLVSTAGQTQFARYKGFQPTRE